MMLVSFVSYVDRTTLALLAPTILADLQLSAEQYGWVISAFSLCYTVSNPAWGAALDRVGLRLGMMAAVALWTAASTSHALAGGMLGLVCARALLGLGEGATFPGGLRAATQTLPEHLRSRGVAIAYGGGSLGAVLTPIVITPVALAYGWRGAFVATGLLGAAWIALWLAVTPVPRPPLRATREPPRARWPRQPRQREPPPPIPREPRRSSTLASPRSSASTRWAACPSLSCCTAPRCTSRGRWANRNMRSARCSGSPHSAGSSATS